MWKYGDACYLDGTKCISGCFPSALDEVYEVYEFTLTMLAGYHGHLTDTLYYCILCCQGSESGYNMKSFSNIIKSKSFYVCPSIRLSIYLSCMYSCALKRWGWHGRDRDPISPCHLFVCVEALQSTFVRIDLAERKWYLYLQFCHSPVYPKRAVKLDTDALTIQCKHLV